MESLPFIAALQGTKDLKTLILDDFARFQAWESAEKSLRLQQTKDTKEGYGAGQSEATTQLKEALGKQKEALQTAQDECVKAIDKHYRTMTLKLHPDRNGEESRPAFEALGQARECLRDTDKRRLYLQEMMQVAQVTPMYVERAHHTWVTRHFPQLEQEHPSTAGAKKKLFLLQGGIANDRPRKAHVSILNLKKRRVKVYLPFKQSYQQYWTKVHVVGTCADYHKDETVLKIVKKQDEQEEDLREISTEVILPVSGIWELQWYATFSISDEKVVTPRSYEAQVDVTSEEHKRRQAIIRSTDELAKQRAGDIQFVLRKLRLAHAHEYEIEQRFDLLHEVVARGRSTLNRLLDLLRADGIDEDTMTGLTPLREALQMALPAKKELEAQRDASVKKDSLRSFKVRNFGDEASDDVFWECCAHAFVQYCCCCIKNHVATLLEAGEAADWVRTVEGHDLDALGGETNRLYQLLVEGRGAQFHALELDAGTLEAAAGRTDLFTAKQCEALEKRKIEAEQQAAEAAELAMAKAQAEAEAKKERRAMELKAIRERAEVDARLKLEREAQYAAMVAESRALEAKAEKQRKLLEAKNAEEREASLAALRESLKGLPDNTYEHGPGGIVEIQGLTSENGFKFNGSLGTILKKEGDRYIVRCEKDGLNRSFPAARLYQWSVDDSASPEVFQSWNCAVCTLLHEGDHASATECDACHTPRGEKVAGSYAGQAVEPTPPQRKPISPPRVAPASQAALNRKMPVATKAPPRVAPTTQAALNRKMPAATKEPSPQKQPTPCMHGATCRYIRNGRSECKFYHSPDEIALAGAKERSIQIPVGVVGWVIGKGGVHIQQMKHKSGANIFIDQSMGPDEDRIVYIKGEPKAVERGVELVNEMVEKYEWPPGTGPSVSNSMNKTNDGVASSAPVPRVPYPTPVGYAPVALNSAIASAPLPRVSRPALQPPAMEQAAAHIPRVPKQAPMPVVVENSQTASSKPRVVTPSPTSTDSLLAFLKEHKACIKGSPEAFYRWLVETEDISSLDDLTDAVSDDDYLRDVLQPGNGSVGVKGFKRAAFKKAVFGGRNQDSSSTNSKKDFEDDHELANELMCPISHAPLTNDPVIAADGHTYERTAIEEWFQKQQAEIVEAQVQLATGSNSEQAKAIVERGVLSPLTATKMPHLNLTPNHAVRTMARESVGAASR